MTLLTLQPFQLIWKFIFKYSSWILITTGFFWHSFHYTPIIIDYFRIFRLRSHLVRVHCTNFLLNQPIKDWLISIGPNKQLRFLSLRYFTLKLGILSFWKSLLTAFFRVLRLSFGLNFFHTHFQIFAHHLGFLVMSKWKSTHLIRRFLAGQIRFKLYRFWNPQKWFIFPFGAVVDYFLIFLKLMRKIKISLIWVLLLIRIVYVVNRFISSMGNNNIHFLRFNNIFFYDIVGGMVVMNGVIRLITISLITKFDIASSPLNHFLVINITLTKIA